MRRCFILGTFFLSLTGVPSPTLAQTASISGTVTDISGARMPHAKVSAHNVATNSARTTETDNSGAYRITNLTPGTYDVVIEKAGFKTVEFSRIDLAVGQVQSLNPALAPGAVSAKVIVRGGAFAPLDLNDAQIGNVVTSQQLEALPLILRDPYELMLLSPSVVPSNSLLGGFAVNGSSERSNNFLLDGTDNNDAEIPGLSLPQPGLAALNPDDVQEFRVITNNFLPEYGRNNGSIVDVITKKGTNEFHGDVYWFGRYSALGARDFFNHELNAAGQSIPKDLYVRNIFGFSASGPVRRNKTFWFLNYEGDRFATTLTNTSIVPTQAFKTGNFVFDGQPVDVRMPTSPNNILGLPLDPSIQKILALYPPPNGPLVDSVRGTLFFPSKTDTTADDVTARIDHHLTADESFMARYTFNRYEDSNYGHTDFLPSLGGTGTLQRRQDATIRLSSVLGQNVVNDLLIGGNRINFPLTCQGLNVFNSFSQLDAYGRGLDFPMPGISGFGCTLLVDRNGSERLSGTYSLDDNVSWMKGRHALRAGIEFRDIYSNSTNDFLSRPTVDFNNFSNFGLPAFQTGTAIDSNPTLQDMVWSLFGVVGTETEAQFFDKARNRTANDLRGLRQQEYDAFVQDSWSIRANLTLSYGLRYEFDGVPYEVHSLLSTLFVSPSGPAPFTFVTAGENDQKLPPLYKNNWYDFEPRVGVAWDPFQTGKTAIRAGFGVFHDRVFGQLIGLTRGDPPFQQIFFEPFFTATGIGPAVSELPLPPTLTATPMVNNGAGILPFLIDPHLHMPYSENWNVGVQRELPANLLIDVNYVGTRGEQLLRLVDGNPPQPNLVSALEAFCVPTNPLNTGFHTATGQCDQSTLQFDNLWFGAETGVLPFDAVNNNAFLHAELFNNAASSNYNALQASVTKRMSHGLFIQGAYTWAHAIDNASDPLVPTAGNQEFPRNSLDLAAERGNSNFDVRQRLVLNYSWDLPIGSGHSLLPQGSLGRALGGWTLAGITTFSGGLPYDIFTPLDTAHTGELQRPDYNPAAAPLPVADPLTQTGPNLGLFSNPAFGQAGNLGRNYFHGPGINNWDGVLQKSALISERMALQFRVEMYNLFNSVQFAQPGNLISNPGTFGQSTATVRRADGTSSARQIQFALKLRF